MYEITIAYWSAFAGLGIWVGIVGGLADAVYRAAREPAHAKSAESVPVVSRRLTVAEPISRRFAEI